MGIWIADHQDALEGIRAAVSRTLALKTLLCRPALYRAYSAPLGVRFRTHGGRQRIATCFSMTSERKRLWEELEDDIKNGRLSWDERVKRMDAALAPVWALQREFEAERGRREPFLSTAPCPVCGIGTVTYDYRASLIGNMKCDNCDCVHLNF